MLFSNLTALSSQVSTPFGFIDLLCLPHCVDFHAPLQAAFWKTGRRQLEDARRSFDAPSSFDSLPLF
jgi:hypothetical protein